MAEVPIYRSQVGAPNIGSVSIAPVQVPDLHSGEGLSEGAQQLGQAITRYATLKKAAEDETRANTAMTGFLTGLDQDETAAAQDPNYETAPQDFRQKAAAREEEAVAAAKLDPADTAKFVLGLRTHTIASTGRVETAALGKHVDAAGAVRGQLTLKLATAAAMTDSPAETAAMKQQVYDLIARDTRAGLIAGDVAEKARQDFDQSVAEQQIIRMIRTRPNDAKAALADPTAYPIDPTKREQFLNATDTAIDEAQKDYVVTLARGSTPEKASMQINKALSPQQADAIYDHGIIQIEHGGRPLYLGGAGGGGRVRSAPAGTPALSPNDPRLAPVRAASGKVFMVDARFQKNFQGFISDYEAAGGEIGPNSGTLGERPNNGSYHPIGAAIDVNQTGRGVRSGGKTLPLELEDRLATKWGLRSGNHFKDNDNGHFDAGGSGGGDGGVTGGIDMAKASLEVSEAGAIGLGQIMPGTAREVAAKFNLLAPAGKPVAQMSDAEITDYLRLNPAINRRLGLEYWHESLDAFDQNIALAAAGYNAGIGKAREYQAAALAKYGPDATPLQIALVIGDAGNKQTHDYVMKLFGAMGTPPTGLGGSTPHGRALTTAAVEAVVSQQQTEQERIIKELAGLQRAGQGADDFLERLKSGSAVWTPEFNRIYETQKAAANAGSTEAAAFVSKVDTGLEAQPHTARAWTMPTGRLDNEISRLDATGAVRPLSHAEIVELGAYRAVRAEIGDKQKTDTIGVGSRAGLFVAEPLDPRGSPDDPEFRRALAVRGRQAEKAASVYGPLLPLRPPDVAGFKDRFAEANAAEKVGLLRAFAEAFSERVYNAAIDQVGLDAATASAGRFALKAPELTAKIVDGSTILATPGYEKGAAALTAAAADAIPSGLYPPGTKQLGDVMQAVPAVYAANRRRDGTMFEKPDSGEMKNSLEEVVGPIVDIGGRAVAAPPAIGATQMETLWGEFSEAQLAAAGGAVDGTGREITPTDLTDHAVLTQLEPRGSEYFVSMPTAAGDVPYFTKDRKPLVIDFAKLADDYARREIKRPPAAYPIVPAAPGTGDFGARVPGLELPPAAAPIEGAPQFGVPAPDLSGEPAAPGVPAPVQIPGIE